MGCRVVAYARLEDLVLHSMHSLLAEIEMHSEFNYYYAFYFLYLFQFCVCRKTLIVSWNDILDYLLRL